ncbi:MAG: DUF3987 domain-containing protein [Opitutaceae bacterium]
MIKSLKTPPAQAADSIIHQLPMVLRQRALLCAVERKVPLEIPIMVGLAAISTAIGKGLVVQSGRRRETRSNLFILLGTASGIGKSEVFRDMMEPVLDFEKDLHAWWEKEPSVRARAGEELLKAQITGLRSTVRKFPRGSFEIFRRLKDAESKRTICSRYNDAPCLLADDATSEALGELMARSGESISTVSSDARYQLKRLSVTDSKEENFHLKGFSGDLILPSRVTRRAARLRSPCLSALYLTQRDSYRTFIEKAMRTRSGLLPRFLHGECSILNESPSSIDLRRAPTIRSQYNKRVQDLIEAHRFEFDSALVKPSKEAAKFFENIEQQSRGFAASDETIHGEVMRRRAEQCWRIALCLHAAEHGNKASIHSLSPEHTRCAAAIVERFTRIGT